jgi:hypothetical protein
MVGSSVKAALLPELERSLMDDMQPFNQRVDGPLPAQPKKAGQHKFGLIRQ